MDNRPAFSAIARHYDATFTETATGRLQRDRVWHFTMPFLKGREKILELNCGTGKDAIWLAKLGCTVLATDASAEMVQVVREKTVENSLEHRVAAQVCALQQIKSLPENNFDLVFSNFGGLNCISPEELGQFAIEIAEKLKPGGMFIAVVMGRFCWWETLYFLLKFNSRQAFRRVRNKPVMARLDADTVVTTWYYSPTQFRRFFGHFTVKSTKSIGFWLPPSYLEPFFAKFPFLLKCLNSLEKRSRGKWMAFAADHFFVCLQKSTN